jgi:hypothetical protein
MSRAILCRAIGTHDADSRGVCRDCGKTLGLSDPVARDCGLDEWMGARARYVPSSPAPVGFWRRWSA